MNSSEEKHNVAVQTHEDEELLGIDDEHCGDEAECEKKEIQQLQEEDPGNQGS